MSRRALRGPPAAIVVGIASAFTVLLAPALLGRSGGDVITAAVLPLGFFAAGGTAHVLRPGHPVGHRLLAVGALHLVAIALAVAAAALPPAAAWPTLALGTASAITFALGFVALLDLLARYPTGGYAWDPARVVVWVAAVAAVVLTVISVLGSIRTPSVVGLDTAPNPVHLAGAKPLAEAFSVLALLPLLGMGLLAARFPRAPALDRAQLRWPMVTTVVVVVGLVTTAVAERVLGPQVQAALFVTAGAALPASFLVGLLRHTEQADRLAAVEASRARLVEVADRERRRIERDLHDGAQQQLLGLLTRVELARASLGDGQPGADADAELRAIGEGIREVHRDLRELARGIHPPVLTDCGLAEAVASAATRLPLRTDLVVSPPGTARRYPATVEAAAYFLVLEGLTNVLKHADSAVARVGLTAGPEALEVTVSDSGRGFDPAIAPGAGSGLVGLRDRLAAVGGRLEVESRTGIGTVLRGVFPDGGHGAR